jgi:hypothetical protein
MWESEEVDTESFGRTLSHPRLKTAMRLVDYLFFVAEYDDHHLAITWEMVHAPGNNGPARMQ